MSSSLPAHLDTISPNTAAAILDLAAAISKAQAQDGTGNIEVRTTKRRETIAPANAFSLCFHASMAQIMDKTNMSRTALRLLFELIDISAVGNLISINQTGLAARLGVSKTSVSRNMKALVNAGIVLEMPHGLFLNPQLISKQGLATVAKLYPREVAAGIEALQERGMALNWTPDGAQPRGCHSAPSAAAVRAPTASQQAERDRQDNIAALLCA